MELPSIVKGVKLNAEQMEALKTAFRECDPEDDGLTCSEFCDFFDPIVDDDTPAELKVLFLKTDASANGQRPAMSFCPIYSNGPQRTQRSRGHRC